MRSCVVTLLLGGSLLVAACGGSNSPTSPTGGGGVGVAQLQLTPSEPYVVQGTTETVSVSGGNAPYTWTVNRAGLSVSPMNNGVQARLSVETVGVYEITVTSADGLVRLTKVTTAPRQSLMTITGTADAGSGGVGHSLSVSSPTRLEVRVSLREGGAHKLRVLVQQGSIVLASQTVATVGGVATATLANAGGDFLVVQNLDTAGSLYVTADVYTAQ